MTIRNLQPDDLPAWMRPRSRAIDWALLIVFALSALIGWPLLARQGIPHGTDAELYLFRSLEVARIARSGTLFSRWAPDFNYGLGSPLFNYLAPLPHYLPGYHQALTDTSPIDSINLFLAASIFAAGTGMFLFIRQRWGMTAGLVGALAYLFSPPISLTLPYFSGDLGALMALGVLPWLLWAVDYFWLRPKGRTLALVTALIGFFMLCDTRIAVLGSLVIITACVTLRRFHPGGSYQHVLIAIFAAVALTSFFWMPALVEHDEIHWQADRPDPRAGPITLGELLSDIPRFQPPAQNDGAPIYRGLGIGVWLLALVGATAMLWQARRKVVPFDALLMLIVAVILIALATPAFYWLWPTPLSFQPALPYHAILVAVFCLAVVGAQSVRWLEKLQPYQQMTALSVLCLVSPLASLAALYQPEPAAQSGDPTYLTVLQSEVRGEHTGTFRSGVLLPEAAPQRPEPLPNLVESIRSDTFDRIDHRTYSAGAQINPVERGLFYDRYFFDLVRPMEIRFDILYYPGWNVSVDGSRQEVRSSPDGLLTVMMPKLSGELVVWLEGTPIRYLAWSMTAGGAGFLLLMMRRLRALGKEAEP